MQAASFRYLVLTAMLLGGVALYGAFGEPTGNTGVPRWPDTEQLYTVDRWSNGPPAVQHNTDAGHLTDLVTRTFRSARGTTATLTIVTSQAPKLYGAGAEVPFLGTGYTVLPPPSDISFDQGLSALVAQYGPQQWLVVYAFGERRGLLGNGPLPWTLAVLDGVAGQSNDYYKLYLTARTDLAGPQSARDAAELAHTLFPRIAAWYAA